MTFTILQCPFRTQKLGYRANLDEIMWVAITKKCQLHGTMS